MKKGDVISVIAKPVAKVVDAVFGTDIQHCAGCDKMQKDLNSGKRFADAIYDRFWPTTNKQEK